MTDNNANNDDDGTQMGNMIMSDTIQLVKNTEPTNDEDSDNNTNLTVDFGLIRTLSLGNLVFDDVENDGLFNNSDVGIDGVEVMIFTPGIDGNKGTADDILLDSMLTANGGFYGFDSLYPGEYYIKLNDHIPAGMISSTL